MSASIGSGFGSVLGGSGRQYYILEHKNNSRNYRIGESQEIIIDQIEIGRDPKCQVHFDESFTTVSRRHAAIVKAGDTWKLIQLSNTNPTFLNGEKVEREWHLQNGDEIQLSFGGPKLGFIIPADKKKTVGSIKMSRRVNLFRQQVGKPYAKAAIIAGLVIGLVLVAFAGKRFFSNQNQSKLLRENVQISNELEELNQQIRSLASGEQPDRTAIKAMQQQAESLAGVIIQNNVQTNAFQNEMDKLQKKLNTTGSLVQSPASGDESANSSKAAPAGELKNYSPFIFAITLEKTAITFQNGASKIIEEKTPRIVGSGFLLDDGRLITARHVVEPWYFFEVINEPDLQELNLVAMNGGSVVSFFTAISSSGKRFTFNNTNVQVNRTSDRLESIQSGKAILVVQKGVFDDTNWAYIPTHEKSGLKFNNMLSSNLQAGMELEVFGFPYGKGVDSNPVTPGYTTCQVARQGLDDYRTIRVMNDHTARGFDGGPVFIRNNGFYQITGVLSGSAFAKGRVVPVSAVN